MSERANRLPFLPSLLTLLLSSCVSLEQLPPGSIPNQPSSAPVVQSYPELDLGWTSITTSHFTLKGYRESEIRPIGVTAETIFSRIANETGLYAVMSNSNYTLTLYRDRDEYTEKTKMPATSRATSAGSGAYSYVGSGLEPELANELTRMVVAQHLDDRTSTFRWIQEGLALNQEVAQLPEGERASFSALQAKQLHFNRIPFSQMTFAIPTTREGRRSALWFMQVESVVRYLMNQGSALSFGGFLNSLKSGADVDQALAANYPGKFRNLADLESLWKYTI